MAAACGTDPGTSDTSDGGTGIDSGADSGPRADASDGGIPPVAGFRVGGTVSGLLGTGLVLQNNAGDDLPVAANGTFSFPTKVPSGGAFAVTIKTQPSAPSQTCSVSGESGSVAGGDVTTVSVNCAADKFTVGGTITGLVGTGLTLQNNGAGDLIVNANGTFAFAAPVASGAAYAVTVKAQPGTPSQTCTITNDTGKVASAKVTNVAVACTTNKYTVGGSVAGLAGAGLVLLVNGGDSKPIAASGPFTFATAIASGATYAVTVGTQPSSPAQTCIVMGGSGTVGAGNVTSVAVNCTTNKYTIGGTASGVLGTAVLQNNGGNDLNVNANGTFAFSIPIDSGAAYAVTIKTQPGVPSQTCTLTNAAGNVAAANVTSVALTCVTNTFKVKGTVSGLSGAGLILQNKGADDLPIAASGAFEFVTPVASGQTYAVTVKASPTGPSQTCTVTNANGTIGAADVTNVTVTCVTNSYTVGGSVAGLSGTGLVLQDNLGDDLTVPAAAAAFTFATKVLSGNPYAVTIKTQPANPTQTCTLSAAAGTVTNGNIVTVAVNCTTNKYTIGGTTSGLVGTGLVLRNNGGDDLTVNGNGPFAFGTPIASGALYAVSVKTQPTIPSQTCLIGSGAGTVGGANVTTVTVTCTTNTFTIGGTITGLAGGTVILKDNGGDDLTRNADGAFTFATKIASGAPYAVTVGTYPVGKYCSVTNGGGTVGAANVVNVTVACGVTPYATVTLGSVFGQPPGTKKVVFVFAPTGTAFASNADYANYCTSHGFAQNQNSNTGAPYTSAGMSNPTNYYCGQYCCYLGVGNQTAQFLSGFQNFGLPMSDLQIYDRGCGDYGGSFNTGLVTVDRLNVLSPTTFTHTANAYGPQDYAQAKSTTLTRDGVILCEVP